MSDDEDEDGDGPRPRTLKWRMIYGAIGATLGTLAGFLGGAAWIDVLCWGAAPCFVVGFVGEPLFTLYMQAGDGA